jgi:hypothetical protein
MAVGSPTTSSCPRCGREGPPQALACGLCGEVLRRAPRMASPDPARLAAAMPAAAAPREEEAPRDPATERRQRLEPWVYLGLGLATAPVFALTPLLGYMGWFLASLVHEMGHSAMAWLAGMPSMPAIALDGHAAAVHSDQQLFLVAMIVATVATALWRSLAGRARTVALVVFGVVYSVVAFTPARELLFLAAGHAGELAFAGLALWKALDGGFTASRAERLLYGTLGWFLVGKNVFLAWGLATSASSRAAYAGSGSFGLTNDYLRIAQDLLGWRLESIAWLALLASLAVVPVAVGAWRLIPRQD